MNATVGRPPKPLLTIVGGFTFWGAATCLPPSGAPPVPASHRPELSPHEPNPVLPAASGASSFVLSSQSRKPDIVRTSNALALSSPASTDGAESFVASLPL